MEYYYGIAPTKIFIFSNAKYCDYIKQLCDYIFKSNIDQIGELKSMILKKKIDIPFNIDLFDKFELECFLLSENMSEMIMFDLMKKAETVYDFITDKNKNNIDEQKNADTTVIKSLEQIKLQYYKKYSIIEDDDVIKKYDYDPYFEFESILKFYENLYNIDNEVANGILNDVKFKNLIKNNKGEPEKLVLLHDLKLIDKHIYNNALNYIHNNWKYLDKYNGYSIYNKVDIYNIEFLMFKIARTYYIDDEINENEYDKYFNSEKYGCQILGLRYSSDYYCRKNKKEFIFSDYDTYIDILLNNDPTYINFIFRGTTKSVKFLHKKLIDLDFGCFTNEIRHITFSEEKHYGNENAKDEKNIGNLLVIELSSDS